MRLGQTEFPWAAGILDRRQRTRSRAAVISRNRNQVCIRFDNAGDDGAHAGFGHQFDGYQRLRVDLLQIKNQLCQVLDGINVVVGRR